METTFGSRRAQSLAKVSVFLITVALIAGIAGCAPTQYDLTISSTEGGEVTTPGEDTFTYNEGTVVALVAEPEEGYRFINWTGDVDTIADVEDAETTITMEGNYEITANFALDICLEIRDWYDLDATKDNPFGSYILMNDLDSTTPGYEELASPTANGGRGWWPIGAGIFFKGIFNGQGYEIRDLFIYRPSSVGLFGSVGEAGVIKDIGVVNVTVSGSSAVGGLVGYNRGTVRNCYSSGNVTGDSDVGGLVGDNAGTVSNSYSTGNVTGDEYVGGLAGWNCYGTVSNSYSTGSVSGNERVGGLVGYNWEGTVRDSYSTGSVTSNYYVGGLVGENEDATVSNSYSTGNVTGGSFVGGLAGWNYYGTVSNSYSTGSVSGNERVGGLVGYNRGYNRGTVSNSYSTGTVTGDDYVGGLVGYNYEESTVSNCYSTGNVTGGEHVGGLVGHNAGEGSVSDSFWDTETSGQDTSDGGTGKTTAEMKSINTFTDLDICAVNLPSKRNTDYTWNIVNGQTYPFLSWEP